MRTLAKALVGCVLLAAVADFSAQGAIIDTRLKYRLGEQPAGSDVCRIVKLANTNDFLVSIKSIRADPGISLDIPMVDPAFAPHTKRTLPVLVNVGDKTGPFSRRIAITVSGVGSEETLWLDFSGSVVAQPDEIEPLVSIARSKYGSFNRTDWEWDGQVYGRYENLFALWRTNDLAGTVGILSVLDSQNGTGSLGADASSWRTALSFWQPRCRFDEPTTEERYEDAMLACVNETISSRFFQLRGTAVERDELFRALGECRGWHKFPTSRFNSLRTWLNAHRFSRSDWLCTLARAFENIEVTTNESCTARSRRVIPESSRRYFKKCFDTVQPDIDAVKARRARLVAREDEPDFVMWRPPVEFTLEYVRDKWVPFFLHEFGLDRESEAKTAVLPYLKGVFDSLALDDSEPFVDARHLLMAERNVFWQEYAFGGEKRVSWCFVLFINYKPDEFRRAIDYETNTTYYKPRHDIVAQCAPEFRPGAAIRFIARAAPQLFRDPERYAIARPESVAAALEWCRELQKENGEDREWALNVYPLIVLGLNRHDRQQFRDVFEKEFPGNALVGRLDAFSAREPDLRASAISEAEFTNRLARLDATLANVESHYAAYQDYMDHIVAPLAYEEGDDVALSVRPLDADEGALFEVLADPGVRHVAWTATDAAGKTISGEERMDRLSRPHRLRIPVAATGAVAFSAWPVTRGGHRWGRNNGLAVRPVAVTGTCVRAGRELDVRPLSREETERIPCDLSMRFSFDDSVCEFDCGDEIVLRIRNNWPCPRSNVHLRRIGPDGETLEKVVTFEPNGGLAVHTRADRPGVYQIEAAFDDFPGCDERNSLYRKTYVALVRDRESNSDVVGGCPADSQIDALREVLEKARAYASKIEITTVKLDGRDLLETHGTFALTGTPYTVELAGLVPQEAGDRKLDAVIDLLPSFVQDDSPLSEMAEWFSSGETNLPPRQAEDRRTMYVRVALKGCGEIADWSRARRQATECAALAAVEWVKARPDFGGLIRVWGAHDSGSAALLAAAFHPEIKTVAVTDPWIGPSPLETGCRAPLDCEADEAHAWLALAPRIRAKVELEVTPASDFVAPLVLLRLSERLPHCTLVSRPLPDLKGTRLFSGLDPK